MLANYRRGHICENCGVVVVEQGDKYCEPCAEDILQWLYAAEIAMDYAEEEFYVQGLFEKHNNLYYGEEV